MNVKLTYLYRDGGNNNEWCEVVYSDRETLSDEVLTEKLREHLDDRAYFDQNLAPLPFMYPNDYDEELDHTWLEFDSFKETNEPIQVEGDVIEFIERLKSRMTGTKV